MSVRFVIANIAAATATNVAGRNVGMCAMTEGDGG
jgi:hypothetical protein